MKRILSLRFPMSSYFVIILLEKYFFGDIFLFNVVLKENKMESNTLFYVKKPHDVSRNPVKLYLLDVHGTFMNVKPHLDPKKLNSNFTALRKNGINLMLFSAGEPENIECFLKKQKIDTELFNAFIPNKSLASLDNVIKKTNLDPSQIVLFEDTENFLKMMKEKRDITTCLITDVSGSHKNFFENVPLLNNTCYQNILNGISYIDFAAENILFAFDMITRNRNRINIKDSITIAMQNYNTLQYS